MIKKGFIYLNIIFWVILLNIFVYANNSITNKSNYTSKKNNLIENQSVINASGMWKIESTLNGQKKTGTIYMSIDSNGNIKGFAGLQRLPGLYRIYGKASGLTFTLHLKNPNVELSTTGKISSDGNTAKGYYIMPSSSIKVEWSGKKLYAKIKKGSFKYNSKTKNLSLELDDGTSPNYTISEITSTNLKLSSGQIWTRPVEKPNSIYGVWRTAFYNQMYIMVLFDDNTVNFIIKDEYKDPPGIDMSGLWNVSSIQNGVTRSGRAFIHMDSSGLITGFGELSSLPGLSTIVGKINGLKFTLTLRSSKGIMTVDGTTDHNTNSVAGEFYIAGINKSISWIGKKANKSLENGHYFFDSASKGLELNIENGNSKYYSVKTISENQIIFKDSKVWNRRVGEKNSVIGAWDCSNNNESKFIILYKNKKMMILQ